MDLHNQNLPSAGLTRRLLAGLYDWLLVLALLMVGSVPLVALLGDAIKPGNLLYQLGLVVAALIFFAGFWSYSGQTLGMRAWRLQLLDSDGQTPGFGQCALRFLYATISLLALGLGFWWMLFDKDQRTWHDRWSATHVVLLPKR